MEKILIVTDATTDETFAVATEEDGSLRVFGVDEAGKDWADWIDQQTKGRGTLDSIIPSLGYAMRIDGPKPLTRSLRASLSDLLPKLKDNVRLELTEGRVKATQEKSAVQGIGKKLIAAHAVKSLSKKPISTCDGNNRQNLINYKAKAFFIDRTHATMAYEIKAGRAMWDPNLGPEGGWRCPPGTRFGGYITDEWGRNCGWGVTRRIINTITDAGRGLENFTERRRTRRLGQSLRERVGEGEEGVEEIPTTRRARAEDMGPPEPSMSVEDFDIELVDLVAGSPEARRERRRRGRETRRQRAEQRRVTQRERSRAFRFAEAIGDLVWFGELVSGEERDEFIRDWQQRRDRLSEERLRDLADRLDLGWGRRLDESVEPRSPRNVRNYPQGGRRRRELTPQEIEEFNRILGRTGGESEVDRTGSSDSTPDADFVRPEDRSVFDGSGPKDSIPYRENEEIADNLFDALAARQDGNDERVALIRGRQLREQTWASGEVDRTREFVDDLTPENVRRQIDEGYYRPAIIDADDDDLVDGTIDLLAAKRYEETSRARDRERAALAELNNKADSVGLSFDEELLRAGHLTQIESLDYQMQILGDFLWERGRDEESRLEIPSDVALGAIFDRWLEHSSEQWVNNAMNYFDSELADAITNNDIEKIDKILQEATDAEVPVTSESSRNTRIEQTVYNRRLADFRRRAERAKNTIRDALLRSSSSSQEPETWSDADERKLQKHLADVREVWENQYRIGQSRLDNDDQFNDFLATLRYIIEADDAEAQRRRNLITNGERDNESEVRLLEGRVEIIQNVIDRLFNEYEEKRKARDEREQSLYPSDITRDLITAIESEDEDQILEAVRIRPEYFEEALSILDVEDAALLRQVFDLEDNEVDIMVAELLNDEPAFADIINKANKEKNDAEQDGARAESIERLIPSRQNPILINYNRFKAQRWEAIRAVAIKRRRAQQPDSDEVLRQPVQLQDLLPEESAQVDAHLESAQAAVDDLLRSESLRIEAQYSQRLQGGGDLVRAETGAYLAYDRFVGAQERRARKLRFIAEWLPSRHSPERDELVRSLSRGYDIDAGDLTDDAMRNLLLLIAEKHSVTAEEAARSMVQDFGGLLSSDLDTEEILKARAKFIKRYSDQSQRRRRLLRQYIQDRYGSSRPWNSFTVEEIFEDSDTAGSWAENAYTIEPFEARDGWWFQTEVTDIDGPTSTDRSITVSGVIYAHNGNGVWSRVGRFERELSDSGLISHNSMSIHEDEAKNKGFQTVFNPHAWLWARAAGFDEVHVQTADDGPYVWGRLGFRSGADDRIDARIQDEIDRFRNGEDSILRTDLDANMMEYLLMMARVRGFDEIGMPEFVVAMSDYYDLPEDERKDREKEIKRWWFNNFTISSGDVRLDDDYFEDMYNPLPRV